MTITRCPSVRGLVCMLLAAAITGSFAAPADARGVRVRPFTLARVNSRCFFAPSVPAMWPIKPFHRAHPIRGGFNEPRGSLPHFGVDIEAQGPGPGLRDDERHPRGHRHSTFAPGALPPSRGPTGTGTSRRRPASRRGHSFPEASSSGTSSRYRRHVHLSQFASCGLVDPRRPTGPLHDPANTERPAIGELSAFVANANTVKDFKLDSVGSSDGPPGDPSKPVRLNHLHGRIDFRAPVSDTPRHGTAGVTQQPLMPAAVRSYLASRPHSKRRIGPAILAFDGSTVIPANRYFDILAFGSERHKRCFMNPNSQCSVNYVFHVAGRGFRTHSVPNGPYLYCVQALTINNLGSRRCTPVVIRN